MAHQPLEAGNQGGEGNAVAHGEEKRVVAALACRLIVMRNGKVVEEGHAADLFARPQSDYTRALFAAAFNLETAPEGVVSQ